MAIHYPGYDEAVARVPQMTESELYDLFRALFGTDNLPCNPTIEDLRAEAYIQLDKEWTDTTSDKAQELASWKPLLDAIREQNRRGY